MTLERWSVQPGTSALAKQSTSVAGVVPDDAYLGSLASDLPFFGWTAIFWAGALPGAAGSIVTDAHLRLPEAAFF